MAENKGKITQIIGAVLDVRYDEGHLPEINEAIKIPLDGGKNLVVEVAQHLGDDTVRCIAMGSTDGLVRGMDAIATGAPISVPVGENTLGRILRTSAVGSLQWRVSVSMICVVGRALTLAKAQRLLRLSRLRRVSRLSALARRVPSATWST